MSKEISDMGLNFIQCWETLRLTKYLDEAGLWTIGWGHLIKPGEQFPETITLAMATEILLHDLRDAEGAVNNLVTVQLSPCQYDALVSLVFNIGSPQFKTSTILRLLNSGEYDKAAEQFKRWNKVRKNGKLAVSNGLTRRRDQERTMFLKGVYIYEH
jgi:lysozyme